MTTERVTQVTIETLVEPEQALQTTQVVAEILVEPEQVLHVTQVTMEILTVVPADKYKAFIL